MDHLNFSSICVFSLGYFFKLVQTTRRRAPSTRPSLVPKSLERGSREEGRLRRGEVREVRDPGQGRQEL